MRTRGKLYRFWFCAARVSCECVFVFVLSYGDFYIFQKWMRDELGHDCENEKKLLYMLS